MMMKELGYRKQVMHDAVAHRLPTNVQPIPGQWPLAICPLRVYTERDGRRSGISLRPVWLS